MQNFSDLTVLVVEDNAINMTIALKALHKLGILARSAQNLTGDGRHR